MVASQCPNRCLTRDAPRVERRDGARRAGGRRRIRQPIMLEHPERDVEVRQKVSLVQFERLMKALECRVVNAGSVQANANLHSRESVERIIAKGAFAFMCGVERTADGQQVVEAAQPPSLRG